MLIALSNEVVRMGRDVSDFEMLTIGKPDSPVLVANPMLLALKAQAVTIHGPFTRPAQMNQCCFPQDTREVITRQRIFNESF